MTSSLASTSPIQITDFVNANGSFSNIEEFNVSLGQGPTSAILGSAWDTFHSLRLETAIEASTDLVDVVVSSLTAGNFVL